MIVYFDRNGKILETVTDYTLLDGSGSEIGHSFSANRGNQGTNSIFCYFDGFGESISKQNSFIQYRKPDGSLTDTYPADADVDACIAYNQTKDMSFFRYGKMYRFVRFDLPSPDVMSESGSYGASVSVTWKESKVTVFSVICFSLKDSAISPDKDISESQFNVLLNMIARGNRGASVWSGEAAFSEIGETGRSGWQLKTGGIPYEPTTADLALVSSVDSGSEQEPEYILGDLCRVDSVNPDGSGGWMLELGEVVCNIRGVQGYQGVSVTGVAIREVS